MASYKKVMAPLWGEDTFRNVLDMNAGTGGFAAALIGDPVWVMNTVPPTHPTTLPVVYDRGLIGVVHHW